LVVETCAIEARRTSSRRRSPPRQRVCKGCHSRRAVVGHGAEERPGRYKLWRMIANQRVIGMERR
jgi:hypothetical protein